jgi:hypothetical protein
MPLVLYPIILIVAVIIFYILGKNSSPVEEVIKTVEITKAQEVNIYADESEESYVLRCQNFIVSFLNDMNMPYLVAPDHRYYQLNVFGENDYDNQITIEPYFAGGSKYIAYETRISSGIIPNDKLPQLSELINRVNSDLLYSGLSLDYENRTVNYKITYKVGNYEIIPDYFWFNLTAVNAAVTFIPFINRIIINDEEPVLVALAYLSR